MNVDDHDSEHDDEEAVVDNGAPEDDDQPVEHEEEGPARNEDGSYDGGVAVPANAEGEVKGIGECDLMLFFECMETFDDIAPNHTILHTGAVVSIGLDKGTKLNSVFQRFCDFLNEQHPSAHLERNDFDFFHCDVLKGHDTAETAALMKNDHIEVRKNRKDEREADAEEYRVQREMDRDYFRDLRVLMPDMFGNKTCDVVLDCRGKLVDEKGLNQEVLRTDVRAHSSLLKKRCKWLGDIIQNARCELGRQSVVTVPDQDNQGPDGVARRPSPASMLGEDEDDDGIEALPYELERNEVESNRAATEIENDDDVKMASVPDRHESSEMFSSSAARNLLWVTIPNHPPDAVRLLLEYCYTNRVVPLGQEAFLKACRTSAVRDRRNPLIPFSGPVAPYHNHSSRTRGWPNNGLPTVTFSVALAGIALAEEAKMKRLSLMCEVAASQLVEESNVVEALGRCTSQDKLTGNPLPLLRSAAMDALLQYGERGVVDICRTPSFRRALEDKSGCIVPSLLVGTMEAVTPEKKKKATETKRDLSHSTMTAFEELDKEDTFCREMERRKRRAERGGDTHGGFTHGEDDWNFENKSLTLFKRRPLLTRNPHHGVFQVGRSSPRRSSRRGSKRSR